MIRRSTVLMLLIAILTLSAASWASAAQIHGAGGSGDPSDTYMFYVYASGADAQLYFTQTEGLLRQRSLMTGYRNGVNDEWGKYTIRYTCNGLTRTAAWADSYNSGSFTLHLPDPGRYRIEVIPYTMQELTDSYMATTAIAWDNPPRWSASARARCEMAPEQLTADIAVNYVDDDTGAVMHTETVTVTGSAVITPSWYPAGYTLQGSGSCSITLDDRGWPDKAVVEFRLRPDRRVPASGVLTVAYVDDTDGHVMRTENRTVTGSGTVSGTWTPSGYEPVSVRGVSYTVCDDGTVQPSRVEIRYRRVSTGGSGTRPVPFAVTGFQKEQTNANNLTDNNAATCYQYTIYRSEFNDNGHVELRFDFNNATIRTLFIRNGDQSSSANFRKYSRVRRMRIGIWHNGGYDTEMADVPDSSSGFEAIRLSRSYSGVYAVELDILGTHDGKRINFVRISDIEFSSGTSL